MGERGELERVYIGRESVFECARWEKQSGPACCCCCCCCTVMLLLGKYNTMTEPGVNEGARLGFLPCVLGLRKFSADTGGQGVYAAQLAVRLDWSGPGRRLGGCRCGCSQVEWRPCSLAERDQAGIYANFRRETLLRVQALSIGAFRVIGI